MTEEKWATDQRPNGVLYDVERANKKLMTGRKIRLFGCGCYRLIWDKIRLPEIRRLVELAEGRADRTVKQVELTANRYPGGNPPRDSPDYLLRLYIGSLLGPKVIPGYIAWLTRSAVDPDKYHDNSQWQECPEQAALVRCVFGNPFRPVTFSPSWRTSAAVSLAAGMYEGRDFAAMPILADALQEAGCDNADVLDHCRGPGPHVRGCWVVDGVLGKA